MSWVFGEKWVYVEVGFYSEGYVVVISGRFTRGWFSCDRLFVKAVGSSGQWNSNFPIIFSFLFYQEHLIFSFWCFFFGQISFWCFDGKGLEENFTVILFSLAPRKLNMLHNLF